MFCFASLLFVVNKNKRDCVRVYEFKQFAKILDLESESIYIDPLNHLREKHLLLLLELVDKADGNLQGLGYDVGRGQRQPLGQRDVGDTVRLVDLNPDEVFGLGRVLDVVTSKC